MKTLSYEQLLAAEANIWYQYVISQPGSQYQAETWQRLLKFQEEIRRRREVLHRYISYQEV